MKMTNLENFETEFASQSDIIKEKVKETMIKHWGVSYCLQNKDILTKKLSVILIIIFHLIQNQKLHIIFG